ncbi:hypothetical protein D9M73_61470 [compost metagenome]
MPGFNFGAQVLEQLKQFRTPRCARRYPDRRHFSNLGDRGLGGSLHHTVGVAVKTFTGLAAKYAASQPLGSDHAGAITGFVVVLAVDGLHDGVRNVKCGQVHQFERAELEADLVAQDAVYGGEIGNAFADDAQCFGAVAATRMVDDKTRCVLRQYRCVPHLAGIVHQVVADGWAGLQPGNDFHHLHQRNRVEKVVTGEALWVLQFCRNGRDRQG